ncbi:MAG: hypothetical protein AAF518_06940 [Spirochaetota bacterium]
MREILSILSLVCISVSLVYGQQKTKKQVKYNKDGTISSLSDYIKVFGRNRYEQGVTSYKKSYEYFLDGFYDTCIEELNIFVQLYPRHPYLIKALTLLSKVYRQNNELEKSIRIDLKVYRESPTTEDGLNSYLQAGKKSISVGEYSRGRKILQEVKNQMYSSKLAKDADIELRQLRILHPDVFPIAQEEKKIQEGQGVLDSQGGSAGQTSAVGTLEKGKK